MEDNKLMEYYMWGFTDELDGVPSTSFKDVLENRAYQLGRVHAIVGDDIRSVDYLTNEEILNMIKNGLT